MIILIDNGHGKETAGKRSPDGKLLEWSWTREIASKVQRELYGRGMDARLIVPEDRDVSLRERCNRVNAVCDKAGRDGVLLVSIHVNAAGSGTTWMLAGGWSVWTSPGQTKSDILATDLWRAADEVLSEYKKRFEELRGQGCYSEAQRALRKDMTDGDEDYEARFAVLTGTRCAAVLTENMFQDNKSDVEWLLSDEGKMAIVRLHVEGIINYINRGL